MNLTGLVILAIFLFFVWRGRRRGLVRCLSGVTSVIISSLIVSALLPSVTSYLKDHTPVYELIVYQCELTLGTRFGSSLISDMAGSAGAKSKNASGESGEVAVASFSMSGKKTVSFSHALMPSGSTDKAPEYRSTSINRNRIKELMDQYGLDSSRLNGMSDEQVQDYIDNYFIAYLDQVGDSSVLNNIGSALSSVSADALNNLTKIEQTRLLQSLPVPQSLRKTLLNFNNSEGYKKLGASTFGDYLIRFLANVIMDILAFFVTMLITHLIVRTVLRALDIFAHFPILYTINRTGGLVIGALQGLFVIWILFLVVSLFSGTTIGMNLLEQIDANLLLKPMYQSNVFLRIITNSINAIL